MSRASRAMFVVLCLVSACSGSTRRFGEAAGMGAESGGTAGAGGGAPAAGANLAGNAAGAGGAGEPAGGQSAGAPGGGQSAAGTSAGSGGDGAAPAGAGCGALDATAPLAVATPDGTGQDALAVYTCATGYVLRGSDMRRCQAGGTWSDAEPSCELVDCGPPPAPGGGTVMAPAATTYGATATYACPVAYELNGPAERTCRDVGAWSGSTPECVDADGCRNAVVCTGDHPCIDRPAPSLGYTCRGQFADWLPTNSPSGFVINADGTVTDPRSGVIWQRTADGVGHDWDSAQSYCLNLTFAGSSDWQMPSRAELESIVDFGRSSPAIDPAVFPGTPAEPFWAGSAVKLVFGHRWSVHFLDGAAQRRDVTDGGARIRCVRHAQPGRLNLGDGGPPPGRYEVGDNGTVRDNFTGLTWQQVADADSYDSAAAISHCNGLALAGGGWRVPTISELLSLVDPTLATPAIDVVTFPGATPQVFRSATDYAGSITPWLVEFDHGDSYHSGSASVPSQVRCVR